MKTLRFLAIVVLSAAIAMGVAYAVADTFNGFAAISIFGALLIALLMGAFDVTAKKSSRYESFRHYDGRKGYGQAAVFLGTVCLYIGTPQDCEELADDLWHHAQPARMEMLTGNETDFEIL